MTTLDQAIAEEIYLELKDHKGTPLSAGELSKTLNLPINMVSDIIKDMPYSYAICQIEDKYYYPRESLLAWLGVFATIYIVFRTFWGLI